MSTSALLIGGTRFIGRHTVQELREHDYEVTLFNRGNHENPFADDPAIDHITGDRRSDVALERATDEVEPDVVVDLVAYHPGEVRHATEIFADVDAYLFISSGAVYGEDVIPKRESETELHSCTPEQATDDSMETYGPRKAEGDRAVFEAASNGVNAMSLRPTVVYGPHDYSGRLEYWIHRVTEYDRVLVPGDGTNLWHLVSVPAVAQGIRTIIEHGEPGEAYNVGDRRLLAQKDLLKVLASAAETAVEVITAGERELAAGDLAPSDFPLYIDPPHVLSTAKLHDIGWEPPTHEEALQETVGAYLESQRAGDPPEPGPEREAETSVLEGLETV